MNVEPGARLARLLARAVVQEAPHSPERAPKRDQVPDLQRRYFCPEVDQRLVGNNGAPAVGDDRDVIVTTGKRPELLLGFFLNGVPNVAADQIFRKVPEIFVWIEEPIECTTRACSAACLGCTICLLPFHDSVISSTGH